MDFAHDTELGLISAAALLRTDTEPDTLASVEQLASFVRDQGWTGTRRGTRAELEAVRQLRPRLRALWTADIETLVEGVNALMREANALPQIVRHDDLGWHLHAVEQDAPLATRMAVEAAMALGEVIRMGETDRLQVCAAPDCECAFVDLSRNRSRRFCDVTCSNRVAAAAYRARQSEESS